MAEKNEWIYDELLEFLGNPLFQIPVVTFLEAHCLVFGSSAEDNPEYRKIFTEYQQLIASLLEGFRADSGLSHNDIMTALTRLHSKEDIRVIFQGLLEQVLASENYDIFIQLMVQKNLELQQQAILLIFQSIDCIPSALLSVEVGKESTMPKDELPIMEAVISETKKNNDLLSECNLKIKDILSMTEDEAVLLAEEKNRKREELQQAMMNLTTDAKSDEDSEDVDTEEQDVETSKQIKKSTHKTVSFTNTTDESSVEDAISVSSVDSDKSLSAFTTKLNPENLKKRQEFLRQQRDKLIEMKKNERQKQLMKAEKDQPQRPKSARIARSLLTQKPDKVSQESNTVKNEAIAMRQAIANRIKLEVMSKK
ncbi:cilia- and flagella-associated protein 36-like [Octopus sinensis]|uniref:Cilia- and flagella-associated protein 36 n=1 Tax=Octopus sinensis TaxID=2607531 RepID=A0A6P7SXJ4_9MOLL|nr:cilia- and flagella-associated protein 36-like [Octopus sinensis]